MSENGKKRGKEKKWKKIKIKKPKKIKKNEFGLMKKEADFMFSRKEEEGGKFNGFWISQQQRRNQAGRKRRT